METKPSPVRDVTAVAESPIEVATETSKEGRAKEAELDNATMDVPADNESTIASRIAYNTGHGDFAFGRLIDRRRILNLDEGEYSMQGMSQGSHGNIVEELFGSKRYGNPRDALGIADSNVASLSLLIILTDSARFRSSSCLMMSVAKSSSS